MSDLPAAWKDKPLLRHRRALIFTDGVAIGGRNVSSHAELGLVIEGPFQLRHMMTFNLTQPWIPVSPRQPRLRVSTRDALRRAHELRARRFIAAGGGGLTRHLLAVPIAATMARDR